MNPQKILRFCLLHDWGKQAVLKNGIITNLKENGSKEIFEAPATLNGFRQIREWAGY